MPDAIYCPRCGKAAADNTSYCRTCGLALTGVGKIVRGDAENAPTRSKRPNFNAIRLGIGLFILGTVLGLVHTVVRDLHLFPEIYGKAIVMAFIAAGLLSIGISFLFPSTVYKKQPRENRADKFSDSVAPATAPLERELVSGDPAEFDIVHSGEIGKVYEPTSVTETTTRQLEKD